MYVPLTHRHLTHIFEADRHFRKLFCYWGTKLSLRSRRLASELTMFMTAGTEFLVSIATSFALLAAILLVCFDVAGA